MVDSIYEPRTPLELLLEKTEIKFPKDKQLDSEGAEKLLACAAKNIECRVTYTIEQDKIVGTWVPEHIQHKSLWLPKNSAFRIRGKFYHRRPVEVNFEGLHTVAPYDYIKGIRLLPSEGDLEKIPQNELDFMEAIRKQVGKYFSIKK